MKPNHLLLLFFVATCFNISAQEFAPYGAEWHYTVINKQDITYHQAKSVDSIDISGKKCRVLEVDHSCYLSDEVIVYSTANGDSVFWYEPNSAEFQLIYAFNAQPGDSWSFAVKDIFDTLSYTDSVTFYVDSIGQRDINGFMMQELHISAIYINHTYPAMDPYSFTLIKSIGSNRALFHFFTNGMLISCHLPSPNGLRCYEDSYLGFYETGIADSCTHEKTGTFVNKLENEETRIKLFPNPVTQTLNISLQNGALRSLVIYDLSGREVFSKTVRDKNQFEHQINLYGLPAGAYMVKVDTQNKSVVKKLIKQ